jgi:two-component system chemotaxis sensor kinase CheA
LRYAIVNEFLEQFLIESRELIAQATDDLLVIEHNPEDADRLDSAFRAFHTLKGAAGIVDFDAMATATHAAEDVLSAVRATSRPMTPELIDHCLACLDQITRWLAELEATETLPETADAEAAQIVARLSPAIVKDNLQSASKLDQANRGQTALAAYAAAILRDQFELISSPRDDGYAGRAASARRVTQNVLSCFDLGAEARVGPDMPPADRAGSEGNDQKNIPASRPMRVEMARIEALVKLSSELIVVKNTFGHIVNHIRSSGSQQGHSADLAKLYAQLDRLTGDILRSVLAARVLPLRHVFQRFPRLVREIAADLNKPVRLVTEGDATEADKVIVEALFEPVLHVLRNAVDHGIERTAQRAAAGKSNPAIIRLSAARQGDEVVIEITDDGRGIDRAAIRTAAVERGLASAEALTEMPDAELLDLIFAPGFSTAGTVTSLSGRGVGMDAVRNAIGRLGGRVAIDSTPGIGTSIRFHLPFSVMLTRVLAVEAGGQVFGVPFEAVVETLQIQRADVVTLGAAQAILWRGRTLPLIALAGTPSATDTASTVPVQAVIVECGSECGAIQVDRFGSQLDLMLKPLDGILAGMQGIAGTALLGDGQVLIVLELQELLK